MAHESNDAVFVSVRSPHSKSRTSRLNSKHSNPLSFFLSQWSMSSKAGQDSVDLWSEIMAEEEEYREEKIPIVYGRRKTDYIRKDVDSSQSISNNGNRISLAAPVKRVSWNRSLSIRGRTSVAVVACAEYRPPQRKPRRKAKPNLPKGKFVKPQNFEKERAYFQEVDAYELLEESPSPKKFGTWTMGVQKDDIVIPHLCSVLNKWLIAKKLNYSYGPSGSLSKILGTPAMPVEPVRDDGFDASNVKIPEKASWKVCSGLHSIQDRFNSNFMNTDVVNRQTGSQKSREISLTIGDEGYDDMDVAIKKLSMTSNTASLGGEHLDSFSALLTVCEQSAPWTLLDVFSKYCDPESIVKIGEGTYGEAFRAGKTVCKIVPIDGDLLVNGEVQKRSGELLEEAILSKTLNHLRGGGSHVNNSCSTFIETLDLRVCQGPYDAALIRAWEDWDEKHGSENDHPRAFPEKQCYVVFVLEHGGKDLESFVLLNFDEVRSLLVQVTLALAVAEAEYEFEHRDLHWGNILLSREDCEMLQFTLEGKNMFVKTFGLSTSIIDFTLSRINTGEAILFLDLSLDPELFKGPKGDKQSNTYRKMKEITEDLWEGSFPKTNVLWLQYLVDILLLKKSFKRTSKDERELRSLKKRMDDYGSAKEATSDPFFTGLLVGHTI